MKRSEINKAIISSEAFFMKNEWALPPSPNWDVTDFGLGSFLKFGLVLVNLAEEPEYCEKLMYAVKGQTTPLHTHQIKKEDIICRKGVLIVKLWSHDPAKDHIKDSFNVKINGVYGAVSSGHQIILRAGERVTIEPGIWHEFFPESDECIIGEVSTANDDLNDNFFSNPNIGRYAEIIEDEPTIVHLVSDN
jgi:D-lyxose ketol-isomerase